MRGGRRRRSADGRGHGYPHTSATAHKETTRHVQFLVDMGGLNYTAQRLRSPFHFLSLVPRRCRSGGRFAGIRFAEERAGLSMTSVIKLNSTVAATASTRDPRIDFLRGLAMICVIVNHSKMSSLLSWFSY